MQARACALSDGVEGSERCASVQIGENATHVIMCGRRDRYEHRTDVDAEARARRGDVGKTVANVLGTADGTQIEPHGFTRFFLELAKYRARNHVTRSKLAARIGRKAEPFALAVH